MLRRQGALRPWSVWYVSIVSIIFDCFMPIFYNFHILLATFYIIFGTNILIKCLVPVPVFCLFFVSQNIQIKWSPNAVKIYGDLFWNICDFWEKESTWDDARGAHKLEGCSPYPGRAQQACGYPVRRLGPFFCRKKDNIWKKIPSKFQPNWSYGSPGI